MIYPISLTGEVGTPLRPIERNIAIDPTVGAVSEGVVFLVGVGSTGFYIDQRGKLYYDADGEAKFDYYSGRLQYMGSKRVDFDGLGRLHRIGDEILYQSYGKLERISYCVISYDSYDGQITRVNGTGFYYESSYYGKRIKQIGDFSFYYDAAKLSNISYRKSYAGGSAENKWMSSDGDFTVSLYYDYSGRINRIGNTSIY